MMQRTAILIAVYEWFASFSVLETARLLCRWQLSPFALLCGNLNLGKQSKYWCPGSCPCSNQLSLVSDPGVSYPASSPGAMAGRLISLGVK